MASYIVTGIHAAARAGKYGKVQDFIAKGGDVNKPDRENCSPLMWACWGGHVEIVKRLLDEGAKPDTFSHQHASALHWATWGGHTEIVRLLLEHKVSLDESDEQDGTPLHYAAKKGFVGLAKVLVGAGATVDVRNAKNMAPLHLACHYNKVEVARFLILKHAGVGSTDHINRTPLHYACLKSHINSVRLLLEWGAEVMVIDNKGKLPLHLVGQSASQKNRGKSEDIKKLLKSKMPEDDDQGLDGSYHPESGGTLMGAAMSVAKNVASTSSAVSAADGEAAKTTPASSAADTAVDATTTANGAAKATNGDTPRTDRGESSGGVEVAPLEVSPSDQSKATAKSDAPAPARKSSFLLNMGGKHSPERGVIDKRSGAGGPSSRGNSPANAPSGGSGPIGGERARKKSTINLMMADGMVSIGDGKAGNEASPSSKRRGSNFGGNNAPSAPVAASRVKRSPQGSVAGESSTKGSERDEMEEVSNEEVAYEMALEQIIADLDDLEERVENLNVDQKTNEDILLNVLKRVDETEKDLRKMKRSTIARDFEAKQANPGGGLDRTIGSEAPLAATVVGTTGGSGADWAGNGIAADQFASKDELGELRQAMAMKDKELRDLRDRMQDREGELDTLRKAGKNLRERLDEKEVETRGIMDRLSRMEDAARKVSVLLILMDSAEDDWFSNASANPGPSLEDFLATDPSQLPFLQERPATEDDYVRYQLFAEDWGSIEHLQQLRESVLQLVESVTTGFIWHREAFTLSVAVPSEGDIEPHLTGKQVFGGNVSDEWLVCYLLFTITSTFTELTARVTDNDGEFLLIEAATTIPPFLSPANSNHRVWVRSGKVHLVMPGCMVDRARTPRTLGSGSISLSEGLKAVRESDGGTEADEGVQRLIRHRIERYPEEAKASMHHARCFLPIAAALAFRDTPGLVAPAVRAFCSGDPTDKRLGVRMARLLAIPASVAGVNTAAASAKSGSQPEAPIFVEARIAFTRHLYAQLHQAAFVSAKAFPPGWGPEGSTLPPAARAKASQLGQKLSIGLEAAYQTSAESCKRTARGDLRSSMRLETWKRFEDSLQRNGFFEGELEGSKRYREKTAMAEQFVRDNVLRVDDDGDEGATAAERALEGRPVHEVVDRALDDDLTDAERASVLASPSEEDDKEDWLEVSQADLDIMLEDYRRSEAGLDPQEEAHGDGDGVAVGDGHDKDTSRSSSGDIADPRNDGTAAYDRKKAQESQESHAGFVDAVNGLDDIVTGMNTFVDDSSAGLDGAEVEAVGGPVQFDVDKFMSLLNGEDLISALEDAANEDGHDESHDSEGDLLESSEEEDDDDDLIQSPQRMPDPGIIKTTRPKDPSTFGASTKTLPSNKPIGSDGAADMGKGSGSRPRAAGSRPSVALQMQEMEGRPSVDSGPPNGVESRDDVRGRSGSLDGKDDSGNTESIIREYMAAMEVELDPSSIGQSFEKVGESISEARMEELQAVGPLDQNGELAPEKWLRDSDTPTKGEDDEPAEGDEPAEDSSTPAEDYKPVDVDMNLVKHLLESTVSQGGLSGPASNLLRSMGLSFPSIPPGGARAANESSKVEKL
eukprot:g15757.t1